MVQMSYRAIVFTEFKKLTDWSDVKSQLRYYAYAEETCPKTGNKHYQGFAYSWKKIRFAAWKKMFPTAHIEQMRGNFRENTAYCSKEGDLIEFGEKPNENGVQGTAIEYKKRLDEGQSTMEIAEDPDLFGQYLHSYKALEKYEHHIKGKRAKVDRNKPKVYIRYGPAGTGKTRWLDDEFGPGNYTIMPDNTGKWFDGCQHSDIILFDDVEIDQIPPISQFLRLTDRYAIEVPIKGGFTWWKPKVIVFTSNIPWKFWWKSMNTEHAKAVERRLFRVTRVYKDREVIEYQNADTQAEVDQPAQPTGETRECEEVTQQPVYETKEDDEVQAECAACSGRHAQI